MLTTQEDFKRVLVINTSSSTEKFAFNYKEIWGVESVLRNVKSILENRPVYHQRDENIANHLFVVFCHWFFERNWIRGTVKLDSNL